MVATVVVKVVATVVVTVVAVKVVVTVVRVKRSGATAKPEH